LAREIVTREDECPREPTSEEDDEQHSHPPLWKVVEWQAIQRPPSRSGNRKEWLPRALLAEYADQDCPEEQREDEGEQDANWGKREHRPAWDEREHKQYAADREHNGAEEQCNAVD
jgi:hypothetical protein